MMRIGPEEKSHAPKLLAILMVLLILFSGVFLAYDRGRVPSINPDQYTISSVMRRASLATKDQKDLNEAERALTKELAREVYKVSEEERQVQLPRARLALNDARLWESWSAFTEQFTRDEVTHLIAGLMALEARGVELDDVKRWGIMRIEIAAIMKARQKRKSAQ